MNTPASAKPLLDALLALVDQHYTAPRALSIDHAAKYLDCSARHVRTLLYRGELTPVDIGAGDTNRMVRILTSELDRFLEKRRRAA